MSDFNQGLVFLLFQSLIQGSKSSRPEPSNPGKQSTKNNNYTHHYNFVTLLTFNYLGNDKYFYNTIYKLELC